MTSNQTARWWRMRWISVEETCLKRLIKDRCKVKNDWCGKIGYQ